MTSFLPYSRLLHLVPLISVLGLCLALLALSACQFQQEGRGLQVQTQPSAGVAPPPSHRQPLVARPLIKKATLSNNLPAPSAPSSSRPILLPAPPPETERPVQPALIPTPDLPSLAHLLNRGSRAGVDTSQEQRPLAPPPATTDTVRAAILLPLSGRTAALGHALLNAAQLALFDFADRRLELLPVDTKGTPQGAEEAAATAIGDGARIILGPLLSTSVRAIAPAARAAGVPVIAFSSDRSVVGAGVYTMGFLPADQVRRIVNYAFQKNLFRFAVLAPDNTYGATVVDALRRTVDNIGAELVDAKFYDPSAQDFTSVVRLLANYDERRKELLKQRQELEAKEDNLSKVALKRLENLQTIGDLPFDALLVADGGKRLQSVAALLPFYDIDPSKVRMLGTGQWDVPGIGAEPALLGGWYAAPQPSARANFVAAYRETYDGDPPRLATMAYDVAALAAVLAQGSTGPDFSDAALTVPSGFDGFDGIFRFLPSGVAERGLAILQVQPRSASVVSPAPRKFKFLTN